MSDDLIAHSGVARSLPQDQVASEVARQMLACLKADRATPPLHEAVRLGRAAGLRVAEMERMSGYTRPTIYAAIRALDEGTVPAAGDATLLSRQVLVVLCSVSGAIPLGEIADRLRFDMALVRAALMSLRAQGMCEIEGNLARDAAAGSAVATPFGRDMLRTIFDDLFLRRPDAFSVYVRLDVAERTVIESAARDVVSAHEHTIIDASVAPSSMTTAEFAFAVHAPSSRMALAIVHDVWGAVRERAGLRPSAAWVADLIPPSPLPSSESPVLDAFVEAICERMPQVAVEVTQARMRYTGDVDERTLAGRCVTAAATALRRAVGGENDPRPITNGDEAFGELAAAATVPVARPHAPIKRATRRALELAIDHLGPLRGGELGSFRAPGRPPRIIEEVRPTAGELSAMGREAGIAVGVAGKQGVVDAAEQVLAVVSPG